LRGYSSHRSTRAQSGKVGEVIVPGRIDRGAVGLDGFNGDRASTAGYLREHHLFLTQMDEVRLAAPSTITTCGDSSGSASATCLKREYSIVVMDLPIESRTIRPSLPDLPSASSVRALWKSTGLLAAPWSGAGER
jgi:hypothetical protein